MERYPKKIALFSPYDFALPGGVNEHVANLHSQFLSRGIESSIDAPVSESIVPTIQNFITISDVNRFVFCMGVNPLGSSTLDPMLVRWSDQEDAGNWTPSATNQPGS